jgi:D-glycero-alpha-D-manno-heptose-7-phosphate kinase
MANVVRAMEAARQAGSPVYTDLPAYCREQGGLWFRTISKYVYVLTNTVFQKRDRMAYSETQEVDEIGQAQHPILRETLPRHWRGSPLEIASVVDVLAGRGMGSSGAYAVCLLTALAHARPTSITASALAEVACESEIDVLGEPVGKQDPYVAAHGGICASTFHTDRHVDVAPPELDPAVLRTPRDELLVLYTAAPRAAGGVLNDQNKRSKARDGEILANQHRTEALGRRGYEVLQTGDLQGCAELIHEHWLDKRERSPGTADGHIDQLSTLARHSGVTGGKLVGAGAGGFLLVNARRPGDTRQPMAAAGASELAFDFEFDGAHANGYA